VTADSQAERAQSEKSLAAPFREFIEKQLGGGRNAFGIYQQLVEAAAGTRGPSVRLELAKSRRWDERERREPGRALVR
jgi:hypothetical protein